MEFRDPSRPGFKTGTPGHKSFTASRNQPVLPKDKRLGYFSRVEYADGRGMSHRGVFIEQSIREWAKYYAEHELQGGAYGWSWSSSMGSKYLRARILNADDAIQAVADFQFDPGLRRQAQRLAQKLANLFNDVPNTIWRRDQETGKLDRQKYPDIARELERPWGDLSILRPYMRVEMAPAVPPTIAVVVGSSPTQMWRDEEFIPNFTALALGIGWACEAAGFKVKCGIAQGVDEKANHKLAEQVVQWTSVFDTEQTIPLTSLAPCFHRDLWRWGKMTAQMADYEYNLNCYHLSPDISEYYGGWHNMPNCHGGYGMGAAIPGYHGGFAVPMARKHFGADLVISAGVFAPGADTADIRLGEEIRLDYAIAEIVSQARKLMK